MKYKFPSYLCLLATQLLPKATGYYKHNDIFTYLFFVKMIANCIHYSAPFSLNRFQEKFCLNTYDPLDLFQECRAFYYKNVNIIYRNSPSSMDIEIVLRFSLLQTNTTLNILINTWFHRCEITWNVNSPKWNCWINYNTFLILKDIIKLSSIEVIQFKLLPVFPIILPKQ